MSALVRRLQQKVDSIFSKQRTMSGSKVKLNWKYALGEIVLIFMGISLAVAFDNWNQQRNKDESQLLILKEIRTDLEQDIALLNKSSVSTNQLMISVDYLEKVLGSKASYQDTIASVLAKALTFPRIAFISAGYQTLKSTDITLIENQSLRRETVEYYEFMHPQVVQQMGDVEFEFKTYWTPWILENIIEFSYGQKAVPIDYNNLLRDPLLIRNFKISKDNNQWLYQGLQEAKEKVNALIQNIDKELERLS